jgi:hypothetical protein
MQHNQKDNLDVTETEAKPRWVKVMAEYSSCGLWDSNGVHSDEAELPVSEALKARLRKWCDWYERNDDYLPEPRTQFDYEAFAAEGLLIAKAIKAELPDWTVTYFDESKLMKALEGKRKHQDGYVQEITGE